MMADAVKPDPTHHAFGDDLSGLQRDLLYTIFAGPESENYGLGIKQRLEADYGWTDEEEEIKDPRLYYNLDRLAEKGLIEKEAVDRRTNAYVLTDRGRARVQTHCDWVIEKATGGDSR